MANDTVFQINDSGLFDDIQHTQGGLTHLMQYLWDAYCSYLQEEIDKRKEEHKPVVSLQEAKKKAPASHFANWCTEYLKENRPVENFFIDGNVGVRLTNNMCIAISPGTHIQGTMQESGAVPVTEGKSQRDMNGVIDTTSLRI